MYAEGYNDGVTGRNNRSAQLQPAQRRSYCSGYRHGEAERERAGQTNREPRTEIILGVVPASYRTHYLEQDGDLRDLEKLLKHDMVQAIMALDLTGFTRHLVLFGGLDDQIVSVQLVDQYIALQAEEADADEN